MKVFIIVFTISHQKKTVCLCSHQIREGSHLLQTFEEKPIWTNVLLEVNDIIVVLHNMGCIHSDTLMRVWARSMSVPKFIEMFYTLLSVWTRSMSISKSVEKFYTLLRV